MTTGLCGCGCGQATKLALQRRDGYAKGEPQRFVLGHRMGVSMGPRKHSKGYIHVRKPGHPRASGGRVYEHLLVAERALGKHLPRKAEVHHVNEDKADNRPANLVICQDAAYHKLLHYRARALAACGNPASGFAAISASNGTSRRGLWRHPARRTMAHHRRCNYDGPPTVKLSREKAGEIRALSDAGLLGSEIARRYGVSQSAVSRVILGQTWRTA